MSGMENQEASRERCRPHRSTNMTVAHGYTLADLDRLARTAVRRARSGGWTAATDYDGAYETAWDAIASHVVVADESPGEDVLTRIAMDALADDSRADRRHHGRSNNARAYGVYWRDLGAPASSPETLVVERMALAQIWPRLAPYQQRLLTAQATWGDHRRAAAALGMDYGSYVSALSKARAAYRAWWHEGETPSRQWGSDRRRSPHTRRHAPTSYVKYRKGRAA